MGRSFPHVAASRNSATQQFILVLNRLNYSGNNNPRQISLKILGAACSPLLRTWKPVLPHANLSGILGWLWRWSGLGQDQTRAIESTLPAPCLSVTPRGIAFWSAGRDFCSSKRYCRKAGCALAKYPKSTFCLQIFPLLFTHKCKGQGEAALKTPVCTDPTCRAQKCPSHCMGQPACAPVTLPKVLHGTKRTGK